VLIFEGIPNAYVHRAAETEDAKWRSFFPYFHMFNLGTTERTSITFVAGVHAL